MGVSIKFSAAFLFAVFLSSWHLIGCSNEGYISAEISNKGLEFLKDVLVEKAETSLVPFEVQKIEKDIRVPLLGLVHLEASNLVLYKVNVTESTVRTGDSGITIDVSGATANLNLDWSYSYTTWLVPLRISDRGKASVRVEGMEVGLTLGLKNENGSLKLSLLDCGCYVNELSIDLDGGASWLYQGLIDAFGDQIGAAVEKAVTKKLQDAIAKLDPLLESLPKEVSINSFAALNVTFIGEPELSNSSLEVEINGLFSVNDKNHIAEPQLKIVKVPLSCKGATRMVGISVHEDVIKSASIVYFKANQMHGVVDKIPDQYLLNTGYYKFIIPQLYRKFPNKNMNLNISAHSPPAINIGEHKVDVTIPIDLTINVLDDGQVTPVICIYVEISATGYPMISSNALAGSVKLNEFTMSQEWSKVGNLRMFLIQPLVSTLLRTVVLPFINLKLSNGISLPLYQGYGLENTQLLLTNSWMVLCSDVGSLQASGPNLFLAVQ